MRSEIIFQAQEKIANRYKLCHAVARVTRRLHFSSTNTEDAIRDAFLRVAHVPCLAVEAPIPIRVASVRETLETEEHHYFEHARIA